MAKKTEKKPVEKKPVEMEPFEKAIFETASKKEWIKPEIEDLGIFRKV